MSITERKYLSKKTGKETVKYYAAVYNPTDRKTMFSKGFSTRKEAVTEEARMLKKVKNGNVTSQKSPKLEDVYPLWYSEYSSQKAERTYKNAEYMWKKYIEPIFGDQKVKDVTQMHVFKWREEMRKTYSAATVNKMYDVLCNIFNFSRDVLKLIDMSPMDGIKRCTVTASKKETWDEDEISYFLSVPEVKDSWYYPMIVLELLTGMRPGEICGIREGDLTRAHTVTLHTGLNKFGHDTDMKNSRSHRSVRLPDRVYDLLADTLKKKKLRVLRARAVGNAPLPDHDYLFTNKHGNPVNPDVFSKAFKALIRINNQKALDGIEKGSFDGFEYQIMEDIRLYDSRHSFATNNLLDGKKSKMIAEVMGNSVTTMEHHYAHLSETMHDDTLEDYAVKIKAE